MRKHLKRLEEKDGESASLECSTLWLRNMDT